MPTPRSPWSLDEYIVVADLYLRRGRSSGVSDPDVLHLAAITGRSPASISRRLGNFDGTLRPGHGLKPVTGEALDAFNSMMADASVRVSLAKEARTRLSNGSAASDPELPSVRVVAVEGHRTGEVEVVTQEMATTIKRREAELVTRFRRWFDSKDQRLRGITMRSGDRILRADLYDIHTGLLIEAKADSSRDHLRYAIGQLVDYQRLLNWETRAAVLLPAPLTTDLVGLAEAADIGVIWAVGEHFKDSAEGAYLKDKN